MALIKFANEKECIAAIMKAQESGNEEEIKQAWQDFHNSIKEQVLEDCREVVESNDSAILAQRGYRQLTSKEKAWYQKAIEALKSNEPKQAFTALINTANEEDFMPTTIIEDVYRDLVDEHPLLKAINFQYVGYITKWLLNDHATQKAKWGEINSEIVKEITSAFKSIKVDQNKLSAYAVIEKDMLDLGPVFLDGYIRTCLKEAILAGLEEGIIKGTGVNQPIGLIRNIGKSVSFSPETGYPAKEKITVTSFETDEYCGLVAQMAKTESGKTRKFTEVYLVCNQVDYLTKVVPATSVLTANGAFVRDLFPIPTKVVISNELDDGEAVLFLNKEYFMGMGGEKNAAIEYSDEYKFLEDHRVFKMKQHGTGRAFDNTCALYLDISKLKPAYITVKQVEDVPEA